MRAVAEKPRNAVVKFGT